MVEFYYKTEQEETIKWLAQKNTNPSLIPVQISWIQINLNVVNIYYKLNLKKEKERKKKTTGNNN